MPYVTKKVTKTKQVFVPVALSSYTDAEKIAFFNEAYSYALENFEVYMSGKGYEEGGLKDFDYYSGHKLMNLLGDGVHNAMNNREED